MKNQLKLFLLVTVMMLSTGCISSTPIKAPKRVAMVIGVKPEKIAKYKELHAKPWQGVLDQLNQSNIHNFSISLVEHEKEKYYLFAYFEYTGDNYDKDMAKMGEDLTTQKWWKVTDPCQIAIPNAGQTLGEKAQWTVMEEVFFNK